MASLTSSLNMGNGSISSILNLNGTILIVGSVTSVDSSFSSISVGSYKYTLPSANVGVIVNRKVNDDYGGANIYLPSGGTYLYARTNTSSPTITLSENAAFAPGGTCVSTGGYFAISYCRVV